MGAGSWRTVVRQLRAGGRSHHLANGAQGLAGVELQSVRKCQKFNDVDAPLSAFEPGNERLVLAQLFRQIRLRQTGGLTAGDQEFY